jgi:thioredoxin reductase (NADPH)
MSESLIDVLIIGAGPAGLQAALHAVRKRASVVLLGKVEHSSLYSAHVENYLCVEGVKEGSEMLATGMKQIERFGAQALEEDVLHIEQEENIFKVRIESGRILSARTLIFATGTSRKKLKVPGEKEFSGKGVSYCVDCDANFYRNAKVVVVGNESAAVDGALTLLGYASEVSLISRKLSVSADLHQRLQKSAVKFYEGTWVKEIQGGNGVETIVLEDDSTIEAEGIFIELGSKGAIELATTLGVQLDMETFTHIDTDKNQRTNIESIYAAGDIAGHPYQMAKAVGEGCVAGLHAAGHALKQKRDEAKKE